MAFGMLLALLASSAPDAARDPRPLQPLAAYVSDADYPLGAIQREASGTVAFTLDVDASGAPTHCTVTGHADPELDRTTCDIFMSRARFEPARDRRGRAVPGAVASRMRWVLPSLDESIPFLALHVVTSIERDSAGTVRCSIRINGEAGVSRPEGQCHLLAGSGAENVMRGLAVPGTLTAVYAFIPDGTAASTSANGSQGELIQEETARLVVTPDGTVASCQSAGPHILRTLPGFSLLAHPCFPQGARFAASQDAAPRAAEVTIRVYLRSGHAATP